MNADFFCGSYYTLIVFGLGLVVGAIFFSGGSEK